MEITIRFDESKAEDIAAVRKLLDQLESKTEDPATPAAQSLWFALDTPITKLFDPSAGRPGEKEKLGSLWKNGIIRIGQYVTLTESELVRALGYPRRKRLVGPELFDKALREKIDPRLHLFMRQEELCGWQNHPVVPPES